MKKENVHAFVAMLATMFLYWTIYFTAYYAFGYKITEDVSHIVTASLIGWFIGHVGASR